MKKGVAIDWECGVGTCGMDPVRVVDRAEALNEIGDTERKR